MSTPISFVQAPFLIGQQGVEVQNLQNILLQFVSQGKLSASAALTEQVTAEMTTGTLGTATAQLIKFFITQNHITPGSDLLVDDVVARAINVQLNAQSLAALNYVVSGYVTLEHVNYTPTVTLYQVFLRTKTAIATAPIDETGFYYISYDAALLDTTATPHVALQIAVHTEGEVPKEFPSDILYNATGNDQISFGGGVTNSTYVEYAEIANAVAAVAPGIQFHDIDLTTATDEINHLAQQTGESTDRIAQFITANKIASDLAVNADIIYALIRQNISVAYQPLLAQPNEVLASNLAMAMVNNTIATVSNIPTIVSNLKTAITNFLISDSTGDATASTTYESVKYAVGGNDTKARSFLNAYYSYPDNSDVSVWDYVVSKDATLSDHIDNLKTTVALISMAGSNPALVTNLLDETQDSSNPGLPVLATFTKDDWISTINYTRTENSGLFAMPSTITGSTIEEQVSNYADVLQATFGIAYPTQSVNTHIVGDDGTPFVNLKSDLETFTNQNSNFDIRTVSTADLIDPENTTFNFSGVTDRQAFSDEVGIVQRLMNVTQDNGIISALAKDGVHSSLQITQSSLNEFVDRYAPVSKSTDNARVIYEKAQSVTTYNMATAIDKYFQLSGREIYALGDITKAGTTGAYTEWRSLFGSLDSCNCSQCTSVYSPSAYMVDMLRFLKNYVSGSVHDALVNTRRPDIKDIELSCKNTNTSVPQIDMVNEMLEDMVSTGQYQLFARQTVADAATQRAIPEYVNTTGMDFGATHVNSPYPKLKAAKYPQTLPYNFYKRQIDAHLGIAGVKGHELIERFGPFDPIHIFSNNEFCFEYIGLSYESALAITTRPATTGVLTDLMELYGLKPLTGSAPRQIPDPAARGTYVSPTVTSANWISTLGNRVDVFLQQTQLEYRDLLQLLDCYTINPITSATGGIVTRKMEILAAPSAENKATCALNLLQITGIDASVLAVLSRFVRAAKALGWSYYELDRALRVLAPATAGTPGDIDEGTFVSLVQLKRVTELLKCTVEEACMFYTTTVDTLPYRDYTKSEPTDIPNQYQRIFCNDLVSNVKAPDYPFLADGTMRTVTQETLVKYLAGVVNLAPSEVDLIVTNLFDGNPIDSLTDLSSFYTYALLIKKLKMTVTEWLKFREWTLFSSHFQGSLANYFSNVTQLSPFTYPLYTIQYLGFVKLLKDARFSMSDVEYLLSDKVADTLADDSIHAGFVKSLTSFRTQLVKSLYPVYDPSADTDGEILKEALTGIIDAEKASGLSDIVKNVDKPYTDIDVALLDTALEFLIPEEGVARLTDPTATTGPDAYIPDVTARRAYVFECLKTYTEESVLKPATVSFFAKEFKIAEDVTKVLLESAIGFDVTTGSTTVHYPAYEVLLSIPFLQGTETISRWTDTGVATPFSPQFNILLQLHKVSILINKFGLGLTDVNHLWIKQTLPNVLQVSSLPARDVKTPPSSAPMLTSDKAPFIAIAHLIYWMHVRAFLGDGAYVLFDGLTTVSSGTKDQALGMIAAAFKTSESDIKVLLGDDTGIGQPADTGIFQANFPDHYTSPLTYLRIINCLEMQSLLPASMKTLSQAAQSVLNANDQNTASVVMQLVKSQFDDKQWFDLIKPVNDMLRTERRDAMVAYLLAYPPTGYENKWLTDNDIYETVMVDVEMTPCMPTTRVLLAINTIQLWVERILLGLEPGYALDKDDARQWNTWRKLYRVWEANRKIFLYPENWIEPELRDGKSSFFLELEKNLKQNDVTMQVVEDAYATYLERLDEVAHLDIVGLYQETTASKTTVLHVFGRTKAAPHIYYYRKYAANEWTPWEKMNVQIDSDHFVPVVWRNRLRFYWLVFTKDSVPNSATGMRSNEPFTAPDGVRWKVDLAWTEYKNGAWTAQQIGKQSWYSFTITEEDPISWDHVMYYHGYDPGTESRDWYLKGSLDRVKKDRLNFFCSIDADGQLRFNINELVVRRSRASFSDTLLNITYPPDGYVHVFGLSVRPASISNDNLRTAISKLKAIQNEDLPNQKYLDYFGNEGYFTVKFNGVVVSQTSDVPPSLYHGYYNPDSLLRNGYRQEGTDYLYTKASNQGYSHYSDSNATLLKTSPAWTSDPTGNRYLVFPRIVPQGYSANAHIGINYFFYKDFKNTFFVEGVSKVTALPFSFENGGTFEVPVKRDVTIDDSFTNRDLNLSRSGELKPGLSGWAEANYVSGWGNYTFHNFHHDNIDDFMEKFSASGLDGLLDRTFINGIQDNLAFVSKYNPVKANVDTINVPHTKVDFSSNGAYSSYNWELFYHIPMLIANKLCQNQQFEDARTWYQYIFNPTAINPQVTHDFWNFQPFYDIASKPPQTIEDVMNDKSLQTAVDNWANDPFKPHLVARTRPTAYMKNTVMKYLDNLIAWGDYLFSTDTRENINEATLLYVLASQILGRRPARIPARAKTALYTYATLSSSTTNWNAFANALVKIESVMLASGATGITTTSGKSTSSNQLASDSMYYFCLPSNDQLEQYWDTIADRLFKIRNCQNIDGVQRELALFDPPIDPALLVKAAASGLNLADVISGLNAPLPNYRFNVLSQKATELAQEVKGLGSQLLAALEKKDAESLALLRSSQELSLLDAVTELKEKQVDEAGSQIDALNTQLSSATQRRDYYSQLVDGGLSGQEMLQLESIGVTIPSMLAQNVIRGLASGLHSIPNVMIGAFSAGAQYGGDNVAPAVEASADALAALTSINSTIGTMAGINAGFKRRAADWGLQLKIADKEIVQLQQQITAAEIRKAIAQVDLNNHKLQLRNAQDMDTAMREKYTNEELYDWMIGQISFSYFQAYKLATDIAKRAERCYQYELAIEKTSFIQAGYWDNLKKGLLAGEQLIYDIKRMETSYLEKNKRQLELTKHISLAMFTPDQLIELKRNKTCTVDLNEWLFDMDYPGHYMRRIKSVSISIPCVAGPYTTISCKLSQTKSKYRKNSLLLNSNYEEQTDGSENRFVYQYGNIQSIATSSAQNDAGMFEFSFRDERYLPFEGSGAISSWNIELPAVYAQFDYDSISDVILHIKYTALDSGSTLKSLATDYVKDLVADGKDSSNNPVIPRLFDMKREFNNEWNAYVQAVGTNPGAIMPFRVGHNMFPYFCNDSDVSIVNIYAAFTPKESVTGNYKLELFTEGQPDAAAVIDLLKTANYVSETNTPPGEITGIRLKNAQGDIVNMDDIFTDLYLILNYGVGFGVGNWIIGKNFIVS